MGTQLLAQKRGHSPPIFGTCPLWPNAWMNQDATWYGGRPRPRRLCSIGTQLPPEKRHTHPAQFLAHVYCGQTAGWIKIPLGMKVGVGPGDIVLDGVLAPPKKGNSSPTFRPMAVVAKQLDGSRCHLVRK